MITILSLDPGTNNCAYAITQMRQNPVRYRIIEHGMIKRPMKDMNGFGVGADIANFAKEIRSLKRKHKADFAIAERYMTRGHGGTTIEAISAMLGVIGLIFGKDNVCFISAAVWKNAWNKQYDLKEFYEELKPYGIPTHRIDAISIGLYGATLVLQEKHFAFLADIKQFRQRVIKTK